jgi:Tol biopolymer transport system component
MFSFVCALPSPASAEACASLFGWCTGTTEQSDFSSTCTSAVTKELLYRVSANGDTPVVATEFDKNHTESSHGWPQFLPDGKHYLFFLRNFDKERTGIYAGSLDSKEHRFALRRATCSICKTKLWSHSPSMRKRLS